MKFNSVWSFVDICKTCSSSQTPNPESKNPFAVCFETVWESKQTERANIDNRYWYRLYQKKIGTNSGLVVSGLGVWSDE